MFIELVRYISSMALVPDIKAVGKTEAENKIRVSFPNTDFITAPVVQGKQC